MNVIGFVKDFQPPFKTKGSGPCSMYRPGKSVVSLTNSKSRLEMYSRDYGWLHSIRVQGTQSHNILEGRGHAAHTRCCRLGAYS
jgi:hypothetical protein